MAMRPLWVLHSGEKLKTVSQDDQGAANGTLVACIEKERVSWHRIPRHVQREEAQQAAFMGSQGEGQDPGVRATKGRVSAP